MLSVISRLQVFRTKQVDEYDISVKTSVSTPCCIAVADIHFCHKKSYRNRQVVLTGQYIYSVGEANSAKKNGPAISLNLSDYIDNLVSLWITVYRSSLISSFNLSRHCAVLASWWAFSPWHMLKIKFSPCPVPKKKLSSCLFVIISWHLRHVKNFHCTGYNQCTYDMLALQWRQNRSEKIQVLQRFALKP